METRIEKVDPAAIAPMQLEYWATLTGPQDAYWQEGLIGASDHLEIRIQGDRIGYCVIDSQNQLMQFHVVARLQREAGSIFKQVLAGRRIKTALAATMEPRYFGLCLDLQRGTKVHTYLFSDYHQVEPVLKGIRGHHFRKATHEDLAGAVALMSGGDEFIDLETVAAQFGDQMGYAKMVIDGGILHVLEKDGQMLGSGELRERRNWVPYADVGMIVNKKYRRMGVGTYLLTLLKQTAKGRNLKPICSCEAGNIGSQKAVENAGFIALHRVVEFTF